MTRRVVDKKVTKIGGGVKRAKAASPKTAKARAPRGPGRPSQGAGAETQYPATARVIKRYGNRRLYDAQLSRCVTMTEIAELVRGGQDVRVVDGDTGEDLTKRTLVQIILEQQNAHQLEMLPVELLHQIISIRTEPVAGWLGQYLQAGAEFLERQGKAAGPATKGVTDQLGNLFPWLNPETWKGTAASVGAEPAAAPPWATPQSAPRPADTDVRRELSELERRFAELSARLGRT